MIDDLLAFKGRCDVALERAFQRNELFVYSLKDGFEYAFNIRQVSLCLLFAPRYHENGKYDKKA